METHWNNPRLGLGRCARLLLWASLVLQPLRTLPLECPNDAKSRQETALIDLYNKAGGPNWKLDPGGASWLSNAACTQSIPSYDTEKAKAGKTENVSLPSHCCWTGVTCCLGIEDNNMFAPCSQYQCNCTAEGNGTVTGLSLGRANVVASLQDIFTSSFIDALKCSLRMVFLGGNNITGTLPNELDQIPELRILSLGSNRITGTIPSAFSGLVDLAELDLSNNHLSGTVPSGLCGRTERTSHLRDLILSNNQLSGQLNVPDCESLIYLDGQNNKFHGRLPSFQSYHQLHILRLGNNSFNGSVNVSSFDLRLLVVVDLSFNKLTGPLPKFVGSNGGQLAMVRLYSNRFDGPIPVDLLILGTLSTVSMHDNMLTGTLPEGIDGRYAPGLSSLLLSNNKLMGTLPAALEQLAVNGGALDVTSTNMSCCGDIKNSSAGFGYMEFNYSKPRLPSYLTFTPEATRPVFDNSGNFSNMRCPYIKLAERKNGSHTDIIQFNLDPEYYVYENCICLDGYRKVWVDPVPGEYSMGRHLTCVVVETPWYRDQPWVVVLIVLGGLLVLTWLTYLMCFRKGKNAAIVQNFFNLRKRIQGEPIGGQVSIVVTDIEGYSDLMKQSPELMTRALNLHNAIIRKSRWNNFGYTLEQEGDSYALVFYEAHDAVIFCLQTQLALNRQVWPEGLFNPEPKENVSRRRTQAPSLLNAISVMTNNLTHSLFGGRVSLAAQASDDRVMSLGMSSAFKTSNTMSVEANKPDSRQSSANTPTANREFSSVAHANPSAINKGHPVLFNGIRVRMGIATGTLPPGTTSKGSAVMDTAKMVSDTANGGQIMMDEKTFKSVKERIEEFGAVDHNGMNYKMLNSIQPPWYACAKRKHARNPDDALLLDMGEYTNCPGCKRLPLFPLEVTPCAPDTPGPAAATPKGAGGHRRSKAFHEPVRLYQVAPPPLVSRAKVFGNKVSVKDEWYCSDSPYFDAPGTLEAPLGMVEGPVLLPAITMAFLIAENGKTFAARYRRDARRVNDVITACIRACLRCVPGGYLCRIQDGDMKYMVAYATPQAAVEWSLLLQDVLMYAEWPECALKHWREEYDERGRLVFRGPRMKIGLCEGSPRSIIPDHIGRADYHGASINQAARYMDAAAHGGMIALEASLAIKVMDYWRSAAELRLAVATAGSNPQLSGAISVASDGPAGSITANLGTALAATAVAAAVGSAAGSSSGGRRLPVGREGTFEGSSSAYGGSTSGSASTSGSGFGPGLLGPAVTQQRARMTAVEEVEGEECPQSSSFVSGVVKEGDAALTAVVSGEASAEAGAEVEAEAEVASPGETGGGAVSGKRSGGSGSGGVWPLARNSLRKLLQSSTTKFLSGGSPRTESPTGSPASKDAAEAAANPSGQNADPSAPRSRRGSAWTASRAGSPVARGTSGPVAEGLEDGGDGGGGRIDDDAAAAAASRAMSSMLSNGNDGDARNDHTATDAGGGVLATAAAMRHLDRLVGDSGPSMTSLTSSDHAMHRGGSSTIAPTAPLQLYGSDDVLPPAAAPPSDVTAPATLTPDLTATDDNHRRPPPLAPVPSPAISCDGSGPVDQLSGPIPMAAAAATAATAGAANGPERTTPEERSAAISAHKLGVDANPAAANSAPQLSLLLEPACSLGGAAAAAIGNLTPNSTTAAATIPATTPAARTPASALRPPLGGRHTAFAMRGHVSFAGDNTAKLGSASSANSQPAGFAPRAFSTAAAAALPPLPPNVSPGGGAAGGSGSVRRPSGTGSAGVDGSMPPSSFAGSDGAAAAAAALGDVAVGTPVSSASAVRSPRPPSLAPLSLPSERERDETLRAERAAAEAARKVQADGLADARYTAHVLAYRIGEFRFKGNPDSIQMTHLVLDHLAGRKFPADAPKGKGAKVGDAVGLLDECDASLPDIASSMRDRYMLSRPRHLLELPRSSPSTRRMRWMGGGGGGSMGSTATGGNNSPGSPGRSNLGKSRSYADTVRGSTPRGNGSIPDGGGGGSGSGVAFPDGAASGTLRRGSNIILQLAQQFASVSRRWGWGEARDSPVGEAPGGHRLSGGEGDHEPTAAGTGGELGSTWPGAVGVGVAAEGGARSSEAGRGSGEGRGSGGGASVAWHGTPPGGGGGGKAPELALVVAGDGEAGLRAGSGGSASAAATPGAAQGSRPAVGMSPLRFMSTRDGSGPSVELSCPPGGADVASGPGRRSGGGAEEAMVPGDERV